MAGKYYDVKFILYENGKDPILDEEHIPEAWHVQAALVSATIAECWID